MTTASSLCGACTEACPVKIDLHHHLLQNRRNGAKAAPNPIEKITFGGFSVMMGRPSLYRLAVRIGRIFQPLQGLVNGTVLDPLKAWTGSRSFPKLAQKSFHEQWKKERSGSR
jgi:L-lactate dehydrogenase complex protein LldF